jgi:hypothetical protein
MEKELCACFHKKVGIVEGQFSVRTEQDPFGEQGTVHVAVDELEAHPGGPSSRKTDVANSPMR